MRPEHNEVRLEICMAMLANYPGMISDPEAFLKAARAIEVYVSRFPAPQPAPAAPPSNGA